MEDQKTIDSYCLFQEKDNVLLTTNKEDAVLLTFKRKKRKTALIPKDEDEAFLMALNAFAKAFSTKETLKKPINKFRTFLVWVVFPIIGMLRRLYESVPYRPVILLKREETNFISPGDLISFTHNGERMIGILKFVGDTKVVIHLQGGVTQLDVKDFDRSKVFNITSLDESGEILWGIHVELVCEGESDHKRVIQGVKAVLKGCKLVKSNAYLVTVASLIPLKISVSCFVKKDEMKYSLASYMGLRDDLLLKIGKFGNICS